MQIWTSLQESYGSYKQVHKHMVCAVECVIEFKNALVHFVNAIGNAPNEHLLQYNLHVKQL